MVSEFRPDGSFHLRPIPARGSSGSKIKSTSRRAAFTPRTSAFDRDNLDSQKDPFRGFYTLFWITVAVAALRTGTFSSDRGSEELMKFSAQECGITTSRESFGDEGLRR